MNPRHSILVLATLSLVATLARCGGGSHESSSQRPPSGPLADGTYVFSLAGQDNVTGGFPYYAAGAFVVEGTKITGGEQDFIDWYQWAGPDRFTGGGVSRSDSGNLQIVLKTANTSIGVNGVETLNVAMVSDGSGVINEFDSSATASGTLDLQTSKAAPSGGYAFFASGADYWGFPFGIGGVINVDGSGTISGNGSVFDINDGGYWYPGSFDPSQVIGPDSFGRVEFALTPNQASRYPTINFEGYVVDGAHIRLVETVDHLIGTTGGTALGQGSNTGTFSNASFEGSNFVFGTTGLDWNWFFQAAGIVTADSNGNISGNLNFNDLTGTGVQAPIPFTGNYTVDSTGRVTLSNLTDGNSFNANLQLYLTGEGHATVISLDHSDVLAGFAFRQTGGGSFTALSFSGKYGMNATGFGGRIEFDAVGPVTADGAGTLHGAYDTSILVGAPRANLSLTGDFAADPSGVFTGTMTGLDITTSTNQDAFTYYLIDTTKVLAIETDPKQMTLGYFEHQR